MVDLSRGFLRLQIAFLRFGPVAVIAIFVWLFALSLMAWLAFGFPEDATREAELVSLRHQLSRQPTPAMGAAVSTEHDRFDAFQSALGEARESEQHLEALFAVAGKHGLRVDQGEYRWSTDAASGVIRQQVYVPIHGEYSRVRSFLVDALAVFPFLAIDELGFRRESASEEEVDASLRFSLYLKDPVAATGDAR